MYHPIRRFLLARLAPALAILAASLAPTLSQDENADPVVATVNGEEITETELELAEGSLDQQFQRLPAEQRRAAALSAIIEIRLLAAEAEEQALDEAAVFQRQMDFLRDRALHSAYIDENVTAAVTEEEVRALYDRQISDTPPVNELRVRHILVDTKEEAESVIDELDAGGDFVELAKENSTDGAAQEGGDLGYISPESQLVPAFKEAAFTLSVGEHSAEPVETRFGWHVLKVEDKRVQQPPAFEEVRDRFRSLVVREKYLEQVSALREAADVAIEDEELESAIEALDRPVEQPAQADQPAE